MRDMARQVQFQSLQLLVHFSRLVAAKKNSSLHDLIPVCIAAKINGKVQGKKSNNNRSNT